MGLSARTAAQQSRLTRKSDNRIAHANPLAARNDDLVALGSNFIHFGHEAIRRADAAVAGVSIFNR